MGTTRRLVIGFLAAVGVPAAAPGQPPAATDFASDRAVQPPAAVIRAATLVAPIPDKLPAPKVPVAAENTFPIDLPAALRLANAANPTVAIAQVRVREALARVDQAEAQWLPTLSAGGIYQRHDGLDQNRKAELFRISRQGLFVGGGASLRLDLGDALYQPLVARRLAAAEAATAQAITNNTLLEIVSAYFALVQAHALLVINADILERDEQILKAARSGEKQGLIRTAADVHRAETEVNIRRVERQELAARIDVASARLVELLVLDPVVRLVPADPAVAPIDLFPVDTPLAQLIEQAVVNRPELAAAAARIEAADLRARQARYAPLIPKLQAEYLAGGFGGGRNGAISNPEGRADLSAQVFWELRGLGFGNLADTRLREAELDRAALTAVAARTRVTAEVVEAVRVAQGRRSSLEPARKAVTEAEEMYRILSATSFGMIGGKGRFDALEPLLAVQALSQARMQYLGSIVEYNRAQFRLLTAVGQPLAEAAPPAGRP